MHRLRRVETLVHRVLRQLRRMARLVAASAHGRWDCRGDDRSRTGVRGFAGRCLNHSATSPGWERRLPAWPGRGRGPLAAAPGPCNRGQSPRRRLSPVCRSYLMPPPENVPNRFNAAGPRATTNIEGNTKITVGKSILTGAFIAFSSAAS